MKVLSKKPKELARPITSLLGLRRRDKGRRRCGFRRNMGDENGLVLLEELDNGFY
jgi:hypothetical protein